MQQLHPCPPSPCARSHAALAQALRLNKQGLCQQWLSVGLVAAVSVTDCSILAKCVIKGPFLMNISQHQKNYVRKK